MDKATRKLRANINLVTADRTALALATAVRSYGCPNLNLPEWRAAWAALTDRVREMADWSSESMVSHAASCVCFTLAKVE